MGPTRRGRARRGFIVMLMTAVSACGGSEPPEEPRPAQEQGAGWTGRAAPAPADVQFVRMMMVHHQQALNMTELVPGRTDSRDIQLLAERIEATQRTEIDMMRGWLEARDLDLPDLSAPHQHHGHMAGIVSREDMARLSDARGTAFDRLFLELMIPHHRGALVMVDGLQSTEHGGQEPELFQLISHIDADQRAEIARMQRMLDQLQ